MREEAAATDQALGCASLALHELRVALAATDAGSITLALDELVRSTTPSSSPSRSQAETTTEGPIRFADFAIQQTLREKA